MAIFRRLEPSRVTPLIFLLFEREILCFEQRSSILSWNFCAIRVYAQKPVKVRHVASNYRIPDFPAYWKFSGHVIFFDLQSSPWSFMWVSKWNDISPIPTHMNDYGLLDFRRKINFLINVWNFNVPLTRLWNNWLKILTHNDKKPWFCQI